MSGPPLTPREMAVLGLMTEVNETRTVEHIADTLFISRNTVMNHMRNVMEKLDVWRNLPDDGREQGD